MRALFTLLVFTNSLLCIGQDHGFPFGQVTYRELEIKKYDPDTTAAAVILDEFGEAYVDNNNDHNIIFEYHVKIKVLKQAGVSYGDFEIPLRKNESNKEKIIGVKASSFNFENGSMRETKLDPKKVYTQNLYKYLDIAKFAVPNVQQGGVIEISYKLESPFFRNFRPWDFQGDIPKIKSEYWTLIPANYNYTISLKGNLPLSKDESLLIKNCFTPGGQAYADCSRMKFGMKNIPAFIEEDFMTAKSNFLSAVNFELMEVNRFDGRKDKITREWKDVDEELRESSEFGVQIKRGKDIVDAKVEQLIAGETDPLTKAQKIYDFIKGWYTWNDTYGFYSEFGIKKAFDNKTGNVGDINLSLVAALKYAALDAEPMLLSTRRNGLVTDLYPVITEFNYVVAKLNIGDKVYLLDATDPHYPFGLLPVRCLNGKGRVMNSKDSYWYTIKPSNREKTVSFYDLKLGDDGIIRGSIQYTYSGYDAVFQRKQINKFGDDREYVHDLVNKLPGVSVKKYQLDNPADLKKSVVLKMDVEIEPINKLDGENFLFNPMIKKSWETNPFKSPERLYPVDFGVPIEQITIFNLEYPAQYQVEGVPAKIGMTIPQGGGQFNFDFQNTGNKLAMNNSLFISKPVFASQEYHSLKELFNHVLASQQTELIFSKKK
ncbi:MAG TPA: hypothetical protein VFZ52_09180 [Chryseolinea sp.]